MIEQLMKIVKRGNKKRSKNITIGAVVGLLLSCTGVIKAADEYLWIRENNGAIEFNTAATTDKDGKDGIWNEKHPYGDKNSWDGSTYVNNMILSSSTDNGKYNNGYDTKISYGLRLTGNLNGLNFINNSSITGTGSSEGSGIYNTSEIGTLTNSGLIAGTGKFVSGINNNGTITTLTNSSLIIGTGTGSVSSCGINNSKIIDTLINSGLIAGTGYSGYGIYNCNYNFNSNYEISTLTNSGLITGTGSSDYGYGIYNTEKIYTLTNSGVIYGKRNAINNEYGSINSAYNYGILANGNIVNIPVVSGLTVVDTLSGSNNNNKILNKGLIFKALGGSYKAETDDDYGKFGNIYENEDIIVGYEKSSDGKPDLKKSITDKYTVINAKANGAKENITDTESLELKDGTLSYYKNNGSETTDISPDKKYILNGITDTLFVSTGNNKLDNSVINAYKTAVVFDDITGGELTLSGTVVNGGIDGTSNTISGSGNDDSLILQSGEAAQNTVINGNIDMGAGSDILTIGAGTIINGTLDGGTGSDTLNFGISSKTRANTADEINIRHNISGFENMNINTNVTLFETTTDSSGNSIGLTVTDAENITIGKDGVLTLRININDIDNSSGTDKIKGHALYGNTGTIYSTDGGKLLLALNGAGNNSIISFGTTELDSSLVTDYEGLFQEDVTFGTTSLLHSVKRVDGTNNEVEVTALNNLPLYNSTYGYEKLNEIYQSILSVKDLIGNFNVTTNENFSSLLGYLNDIYAGNPYSYSSELSRKSMGMFRDIITENQFKADTGKWLIYGGLTHVDGGNKDTYYGKGYYTYDIGSSDIEADTKITGAYILGEYGVSDTLTSGVIVGGNKLKSNLSNGSKVDGDALYIGGYVKKYAGNLKVTAGAGLQYGDYDIDRAAAGKGITETRNYSSNYNDMSYDIYLNGRYSNPIGDNLYLEPYGTLSYTYIKQDGADEGNKTLAIETDSKSFDYTSAKVGVDLKKVISHEKGKSTLSAGVSYTRILNGADEEYITGRFKGGKDFDILVAHKNEHSIGLNAKYALELENGVLFDVKGTYAVERDSNNNSGKNKTKGEWIVGAGLGYKF